jgi:glycosyltransferase involved in cell wall biosynthesis
MADSTSPPRLSIVIPARNEERRLPPTLERIADYVLQRKLDAEVIVVSDNSSDGTIACAQGFAPRFPRLTVLQTAPEHYGKGGAVRTGMLAARGPIALFTDADLSAPIEEADKLLAALETHDVAIGSRAVNRALIEVHQSRRRELAGIAFNWAVQLVTGLRLVDTQCGFKAFRLPAARIAFEQQRIMGFGFDPEVLFLAQRHGLRIAEIPVRWAHDPDTKVRVLRDGLGMGVDLLRIRLNALRGRYPRCR